MTLTITIHSTWGAHPGPLSRILAHVQALESPAPWTPPVAREPGDDDDGLAHAIPLGLARFNDYTDFNAATSRAFRAHFP